MPRLGASAVDAVYLGGIAVDKLYLGATSVYTALAPPSQVTGLTVDSTGDGTIDLSWAAPASEAAITDYSVEYTPSGGSATTVLVGSATTTYQLASLTNDTAYSVRVAAVSAAGTGAYSTAVTGTPSAFSPADITGLQLWLDASDASTLYDATTGGSLVAADGGVARWEDKSGNGRHATQGTSANRPVRRAAVVNAKDVLEFDGSNDGFSVNSIVGTFGGSNSPFSVFAVAKADVTNATQDILSSAASFNDEQNIRCVWNNGSQKPTLNREPPVGGTTKIITGGTSLGTNTRLVSYLFDASDGTLFVDGSSDAAATDLSQANTIVLDAVAIGFLPRLNPAVYFNGDVCEVLVYNSALSDTDRTAVENYLLAKWGIT